jgi:hypothetical protein
MRCDDDNVQPHYGGTTFRFLVWLPPIVLASLRQVITTAVGQPSQPVCPYTFMEHKIIILFFTDVSFSQKNVEVSIISSATAWNNSMSRYKEISVSSQFSKSRLEGSRIMIQICSSPPSEWVGCLNSLLHRSHRDMRVLFWIGTYSREKAINYTPPVMPPPKALHRLWSYDKVRWQSCIISLVNYANYLFFAYQLLPFFPVSSVHSLHSTNRRSLDESSIQIKAVRHSP